MESNAWNRRKETIREVERQAGNGKGVAGQWSEA